MWDLQVIKTINQVALEIMEDGRNQSDALRILTDQTRKQERKKILKSIQEYIEDDR